MDGNRVASFGAPSAPRLRALPRGSVLLHVGPHKTGTSSIQSAFHVARRAIAAHGVRYAGPNRHPVRAAQAAITRGVSSSGTSHSIRPWRNLLDRIERDLDRDPTARVVLSSEWFADATPEAARRIVDELGPDRTHVVVTLRPLARLLPSQWQQYVQAGRIGAYEPWLSDVLAEPPGPSASGFWHRHRHDALIGRWASIVGREAVTAIVVDDRDHGSVLRALEQLVGVPAGVLIPEDSRINRSLTWPEAELVRAVNEMLRRETLEPTVRLNLVLYGVAAGLRTWRSGADDRRIENPAWANPRIAALSREIAAGVVASGVTVVGDVRSLAETPPSGAAEAAGPSPDRAAWARLVAVGALGVLTGAGLLRDAAGRDETDVVSTSRLGQVLVGRLRTTVIAPLAAIADRAPASARSSSSRLPAGPAPRTAPVIEPAPLQVAILEALDAELEAHAAGAGLRDRVIAAATAAMREHGREAGSGADPDRDAAPSIGAAAILGVVRSTGLSGEAHGPAVLRAEIAAARRRRTGETIELARLPTGTLARVVAGRVLLRREP